MDHSTLSKRAATISKTANDLSNVLTRLGLPEPTFEHGLPTPLQTDAPDSKASNLRQELLLMLDEMRALLTEPTLLLTPELVSFTEIRSCGPS